MKILVWQWQPQYAFLPKKTVKEQKIPFEITAGEPFYSKANMKYLEKVIEKIDSGKAKLKEHELIEE